MAKAATEFLGLAGLAKGLGQAEQRVQVVRRQAERRRELFERLDRQAGVVVERSQRQVRLPVSRIQLRGTGDLFHRLVVLAGAAVGLAQAQAQEGTVRRSGHAVFVHLERVVGFFLAFKQGAQLQIGAGIGRVDLDGLPVAGDGLVGVAGFDGHVALLGQRRGRTRVISSRLQRLFKRSCGLVCLALGAIDIAQL